MPHISIDVRGKMPQQITGLTDGTSYIAQNTSKSIVKYVRLADGTTPPVGDPRAQFASPGETFYVAEVAGETNWMWFPNTPQAETQPISLFDVGG